MSNNKILIFGLLFTIGFGVALFWPKKVAEEEYSATISSASSDKIEVVMYKNPGCQCCTKWAALMNDDQFEVVEKPIPNLMEVKREKDLPREIDL